MIVKTIIATVILLLIQFIIVVISDQLMAKVKNNTILNSWGEFPENNNKYKIFKSLEDIIFGVGNYVGFLTFFGLFFCVVVIWNEAHVIFSIIGTLLTAILTFSFHSSFKTLFITNNSEEQHRPPISDNDVTFVISIIIIVSGTASLLLFDLSNNAQLFVSIGIFSALIVDVFSTMGRVDEAPVKGKLPLPHIAMIALPVGCSLFAIYHIGFGVFIILKQIVTFMNSGIWEPYTAIELISQFQNDNDFSKWIIADSGLIEWLTEPKELLGVHKILNFLNGGLSRIILGVSIYALSYLPWFLWDREFEKKGLERKEH